MTSNDAKRGRKFTFPPPRSRDDTRYEINQDDSEALNERELHNLIVRFDGALDLLQMQEQKRREALSDGSVGADSEVMREYKRLPSELGELKESFICDLKKIAPYISNNYKLGDYLALDNLKQKFQNSERKMNPTIEHYDKIKNFKSFNDTAIPAPRTEAKNLFLTSSNFVMNPNATPWNDTDCGIQPGARINKIQIEQAIEGKEKDNIHKPAHKRDHCSLAAQLSYWPSFNNNESQSNVDSSSSEILSSTTPHPATPSSLDANSTIWEMRKSDPIISLNMMKTAIWNIDDALANGFDRRRDEINKLLLDEEEGKVEEKSPDLSISTKDRGIIEIIPEDVTRRRRGSRSETNQEACEARTDHKPTTSNTFEVENKEAFSADEVVETFSADESEGNEIEGKNTLQASASADKEGSLSMLIDSGAVEGLPKDININLVICRSYKKCKLSFQPVANSKELSGNSYNEDNDIDATIIPSGNLLPFHGDDLSKKQSSSKDEKLMGDAMDLYKSTTETKETLLIGDSEPQKGTSSVFFWLRIICILGVGMFLRSVSATGDIWRNLLTLIMSPLLVFYIIHGATFQGTSEGPMQKLVEGQTQDCLKDGTAYESVVGKGSGILRGKKPKGKKTKRKKKKNKRN